MMEAANAQSRPLSRQALAALQERVGAGPSDVPGKSRPSSRVSAGSASSMRMESLQEELAETERRMAATRQRQLKAEQALEGVMGQRHAFDQQLLQRVRAAGRGLGATTASARRPSPLQQAGAAMQPQQQDQEQEQQGAEVPDERYQELLALYQAECEARQAAQQHLWALQGQLNVAVEEREAVLQSLHGIHALYGDMGLEEEALNPSGQHPVDGGEDVAFSWGSPGSAGPWADNRASAAAPCAANDDAAGSEPPPSFEELQVAWRAVRAENEALQAEVRLTQAERDAVLSKLDEVETELSLAAGHQQAPASAHQQQHEGEAAAAWDWYSSPLPPDRISPESTIEGGSEEITPLAGVPPELLRRAGSTTPDLSLDPSPTKPGRQGREQQQQQQQQQEHGKQGQWQQDDGVQQEGVEGSEAGVVEPVAADVLGTMPQYQELRAVLQRLGDLVGELVSGQAGAAAAGGANNRATLAALQRHVAELQARSAVVCDELETTHAVVEDLQGGLARERKGRMELEGRLAAAQRESRAAERERAEMQQHLRELQELVEAAIDEAEGSWTLLQKVTSEEGRGKKLKVGELWTQLMEAEQRATSVLRAPKSAPAPSDGSTQQQRRLYEAWRALEGSRQQGDGEVDSVGAWKRKLAQRSASSLRSRLASLNTRFHHEDDTSLPAAPGSGTQASAAASAAGVDGAAAGAAPSAAQLTASNHPQAGFAAGNPAGVLAERSSRPHSAPPDARWSPAASRPLATPSSLAAPAGWATPPATGAAGLLGENGSVSTSLLAVLQQEPVNGAGGQLGEQVAAELQQRLACAREGPGKANAPQAAGAVVASLAGVPGAAESLWLVEEELPPRTSPASSLNGSPASTASSATPQAANPSATAAAGSASSVSAGRDSACRGAGSRGGGRGGSPPLQLSYMPVGLHSPPLVPRSRSSSARSSPAAGGAASLGGAAATGGRQRAASPDLPYFRRDEDLPLAAHGWWVDWLFPLPLRLLCANIALLALAPVNLLLFNRASACVSAGGSNFMGALFWLALMQRLPQGRGQQQEEQWRGVDRNEANVPGGSTQAVPMR